MMQCMVTRRRMTGRKKANLVPGSCNPGLATLIGAGDQQQQQSVIDCSNHLPGTLHMDPLGLKCSSSNDVNNSEITDKCPAKVAADSSAIMCNRPRAQEANCPRGYGEGSLNSGPLQRVCLGNGARHNPYPKVAEIRDARRASLDRGIGFRKQCGVRISSLVSYFSRQRVVPEKLTADDSTGKFAYISLDGRLINAELATSATNVGGDLGQKKVQAWEDFTPMYRVLIVALSAAAAAAAKHKNSKEIQKLLTIVTEQENELVLMRQQLSELCMQSFIDPTNLESRTEHPEPASSTCTKGSPRSPRDLVHPGLSNVQCAQRDLTDVDAEVSEGLNLKDKLDLRLTSPSQGDPELTLGECEVLPEEGSDSSRDDVVNKNVVLVETPSREEWINDAGKMSSLPETTLFLENSAEEEAIWYVNPMVDGEENYYDMCTLERGNPMLSTCTPAIQRSFEWTPLRSSFRGRDSSDSISRLFPLAETTSDPSAQVIPCTASYGLSSPKQEEGVEAKELTALRKQCAAVVLNLKTQLMTVLDKEASRFLVERDLCVNEEKAEVASLLSVVVDCWREAVPEALAGLGLSPSEYNYLLNDAQETEMQMKVETLQQNLLESDVKRDVAKSKLAASIQSDLENQAKLHEKITEITRQLHLQEVEIAELTTEEKLTDAKFADVKRNLESKVHADVAEMKESLHLKALRNAELTSELQSKERLIADMERNHKAKLQVDMAEMKRQLQLKELRICELTSQIQLKEVEIADLERTQKAKLHVDVVEMTRELQSIEAKIVELTRQLQLKDVQIAELERTHKDILITKNEELSTLREESVQRNAELQEVTAAAQATKIAAANRISRLEDFCRCSTAKIFDLKQEVLALESKMSTFKPLQSPAMLRGRRSFMSIATPPSREPVVASFESQIEKTPSPPSLAMHAQVHPHFKGIQKTSSNETNSSVCSQIPVEVVGGRVLHDEIGQDKTGDFTTPPASTVRDHNSELEEPGRDLSVDKSILIATESCSPNDDNNLQASHKQSQRVKPGAWDNVLTEQKRNTADLNRVLTSSTSTVPSLGRVRANMTFTSAATSRRMSGSNQLTKSAENSIALNKKARRKEVRSPRSSLSGAVVLGSITPNTPIDTIINKRKASSIELNGGVNSFVGDGGSLDGGSKENSALKRRGWV